MMSPCVANAVAIADWALDAPPQAAWAGGPATHCVVTVKEVKLKNTDNDWITVPIPETKLDFANPEQTLTFKNDGRVPEGKYKNFKFVISETFQVSGHDGNNFTAEGGDITIGGTAHRTSELPGDITSIVETKKSWNTAKEGLMTVKVNMDFEDRDDVMEIYGVRDIELPFRVKENALLTFMITMNMDQCVYFAWPDSLAKNIPSTNVMYYLTPKTIAEVSVKSDSQTATFDNEFIDIAF
jgi:hypothetical protein